ncbi:MAG TPA: IS200/IS605 family transposase [Urbifossiella sp.]|nr:IS200/IS605 family transposase [Urbifossiella sp.]
MAQSLSRLLVHLVFSTKGRSPLLPQTPYGSLHAYAQGIFKTQKCHMIEMNNVTDHVHILFDLHRTEALSDVVMHVKKGTSRWLKEQSADLRLFDWQEGYGAFSIGRSQRDDVVGYIRKQQERHRDSSFQDEFRTLLGSYEIEFDERYLWD